MTDAKYEAGDWVIYRKSKYSADPGPRAQQVAPASHGDEYSYLVEKFWTVAEAKGDRIVLRTRRGKTHELTSDDRNLRRARWWERWLYRDRFPALEKSHAASD